MTPPLPTRRCALVTRPRAQGEVWQRKLLTLGVPSELLPLIDIGAAPDPEGLHRWWSAEVQPLATDAPPRYAVLMFVSPNAASSLFRTLPNGWRWPEGLWAAATGPGTVTVLLGAGVPASLIVAPPADAAQFDSESLWSVLKDRVAWPGRQVAIVRGEGGRDWLARTLREAGAEVTFVQSYERRAPVLGAVEQALLARALAEPQDHVWLLSSSEAVDHLRTVAPHADWAASVALASHPRIAEAARHAGFGHVVEVRPVPEAVAEALGTLPAPGQAPSQASAR
ncbi:uroporphyrinogen-III synthase [Ideonella sp. DXS29W]|uniref:Uroporphyrinogen-III synthase n=1 Tax=Ideonella lacteola TaxID=2984193 RepID=A0ABU9BS48_9BURK